MDVLQFFKDLSQRLELLFSDGVNLWKFLKLLKLLKLLEFVENVKDHPNWKKTRPAKTGFKIAVRTVFWLLWFLSNL